MNNKNQFYEAPQTEWLLVKAEGNFLASTEQLTRVSGSWDDEEE